MAASTFRLDVYIGDKCAPIHLLNTNETAARRWAQNLINARPNVGKVGFLYEEPDRAEAMCVAEIRPESTTARKEAS